MPASAADIETHRKGNDRTQTSASKNADTLIALIIIFIDFTFFNQ